VVLLATYALGWSALLGYEYKQLGKHIAAGAGFISNFILWKESGYFDNAAATKPLLHLWSLGVEEQFYALWPITLWLGWKYRLNLLAVTIGISAISFALNVTQASIHPVATFYSPLTRFWELMMGAILAYSTLHGEKHNWKIVAFFGFADHPNNAALVLEQKLRTVQSIIGALLVTVAVLFGSEKTTFPEWAALPTIGTLLIISAGPKAWINRVVLSSRFLVWLGLISYPLYLWHWPLLSFTRIIQGSPPSPLTVSVIVLLSIALASLTYQIVEKPIRFGKNGILKIVVLISAMAVIGYIGFTTYQRDGLNFRSVVRDSISISMDSGRDGGLPSSARSCDFLKPEDTKLFYCASNSRADPRYALLGDSKAEALFEGLLRTSVESHTWMYILNKDDPPLLPVLSDDPIYSHYKKKQVEAAIDIIGNKQSIHTVVIAAATRALFQLENDYSIDDLPSSKNYGPALNGLDQAVTKLITFGKNVVLVMDTPTLPHKEDCIERKTSSSVFNSILLKSSNPNCHIAIQTYRQLSNQYRDLLLEIERTHPGKVRIFDATTILCDVQKGICSIEKNGRLLYGYTDHISDYASTLVGTALNQFLDRNP
jgi:peptidoglycan/LPS O-acetylase OafA/YrhL